MPSNLPGIKYPRKSGQEPFYLAGCPLEFDVLEFWQWFTSDLLSNTTRGFLAEFIVAKALGIGDDVANDWGGWDLDYKGLKIEVKTSAYIQSWYQEKLSQISFDIAPKTSWDSSTNEYDEEVKRHADVYVFCLLDHKDQNTIDLLNLDQWTFFVLETKVLNELSLSQKTITLSSLKNLGPVEVGYDGLKKAIDNLLITNK